MFSRNENQKEKYPPIYFLYIDFVRDIKFCTKGEPDLKVAYLYLPKEKNKCEGDFVDIHFSGAEVHIHLR
jgi:hypothetical protein